MKKSTYSFILTASLASFVNFQAVAFSACKNDCLDQKQQIATHCLTDKECEHAVLLSCVKNCEPDVTLVSMKSHTLTHEELDRIAEICENDTECMSALRRELEK